MFIGLDTKDTYNNMDSITAVLYTFIYNLDFPIADIDELRYRLVNGAHTLEMNDAGDIEEFDADGDFYVSLDCYAV